MLKVFKVIAIVTGLFVLAAASFGAFAADGQTAEAAYNPVTYKGSVVVDGKAPQYDGWITVHKWNGHLCGGGKVYALGGSAFFIIEVHTANSQPGCFEGGDPMIFKFNGMKALEIPTFTEWGGEHVVALSFASTRYFQCTPALCPISSQPVFVLPPQR